MQTGNTLQPKFEYAQVFDIRVPGPIDSRFTVSTVANIATELPSGVRYKGLLVWVDNENRFYHFKNGITDTDFVLFVIPAAINTTYKFVYALPSLVNNDVFLHNLNTQDFIIQFFLDNKPVTIDYEFLPFNGSLPTEHLNKIQFKLASGQTVPAGIKVVITA